MWLIFVEVWRPVRPRIVIEAFLLFAVTLSTAVGLIKAAPWTAYGWLNLLLRKGGNLLVAPVLAMSDSPRFGLRLIPILFLLLLFFAMPTLAFAEEMIFRSKIRSKAGLFRQALLFGPAHLLAGVPVAVGAAIILVGFFLGYKFMNTKRKRARMWAKRLHLPKNNKHIVEVAVNEAVYNSTMYHTVLNTIALSIALVLCISKLF
ncbi:MAG: hypothetical protein Q7R83_03235 [bacterium]|nr:hypothetical protein [bacterium]